MAPFEEMSATEKEEFIISLAVLICADAKVEITVFSFIFFLNCRKKTLISLLRNLVIPLLLTGQLSSLLILEIRIFLNVLLLLVFIFYESVIFLGVGAMTDFCPLLANPNTLFLGAAAQFGVFISLAGAMALGFSAQEASAIGIIGGADGPTAIYMASKMAPQLLGAIAVAAYSYMSLVPLIQPPIMTALTTKEERSIVMEQLREVTKFERLVFPVAAAILISLLLPPVASLISMLMLGNLFRESGVTDRLSDTAQNALCNIVTIFLALGTGMTMNADAFLTIQTVEIILLGLLAFAGGTAAGLILGKIMCKMSGGKINPLIGSAGVSAVPMAARVSQMVGSKANPANFLLMHAMGPNVSGVIGTAVAAGTMMAMLNR